MRDLIDCENCAGVKFRLGRAEGDEVLSIVQMVSCPVCGEYVPVDEDTPEGAVFEHDGKRLRLSKEFGAFVLEPAE